MPDKPSIFDEVLGGKEFGEPTQEVYEQQARQDMEAAQENLEFRGGFERGFTSALHGQVGMFHGLRALANEFLGDEEARDKAIKDLRYRERMASRYPRKVPKFFSTDPETGAFGGGSNLPDWIAETAGTIMPSILEAVATGITGGAIGTATLSEAGLVGSLLKKKAVKQATKTLAKETMKQGFEKKAAYALAERMTKEMVDQAAKQAYKQALRGTIKATGAKAAIFGLTSLQETGGMFGDLAKKGIYAPTTSVLLGGLSGLSEIALGSVPGVTNILTGTAVREGLTKGGVKAAIKAFTKQMFEEGAQETIQELISNLNQEINDPKYKITDKESMEQVLEALAAGMLGGAMFAPMSSISAFRGDGPIDLTQGKPKGFDVEVHKGIAQQRAAMERGLNMKLVDAWAILNDAAPDEAAELAKHHARMQKSGNKGMQANIEQRVLMRAKQFTQEGPATEATPAGGARTALPTPEAYAPAPAVMPDPMAAERANLTLADAWRVLQQESPEEAMTLAEAYERNPEVVGRRIIERAGEFTQAPGYELPTAPAALPTDVPPTRTALPAADIPPSPSRQDLEIPEVAPREPQYAWTPTSEGRTALPTEQAQPQAPMTPDEYAEQQYGPASRREVRPQDQAIQNETAMRTLEDELIDLNKENNPLTDDQFRKTNAAAIERFERAVGEVNPAMAEDAMKVLRKKIAQYNVKSKKKQAKTTKRTIQEGGAQARAQLEDELGRVREVLARDPNNQQAQQDLDVVKARIAELQGDIEQTEQQTRRAVEEATPAKKEPPQKRQKKRKTPRGERKEPKARKRRTAIPQVEAEPEVAPAPAQVPEAKAEPKAETKPAPAPAKKTAIPKAKPAAKVEEKPKPAPKREGDIVGKAKPKAEKKNWVRARNVWVESVPLMKRLGYSVSNVAKLEKLGIRVDGATGKVEIVEAELDPAFKDSNSTLQLTKELLATDALYINKPQHNGFRKFMNQIHMEVKDRQEAKAKAEAAPKQEAKAEAKPAPKAKAKPEVKVEETKNWKVVRQVSISSNPLINQLSINPKNVRALAALGIKVNRGGVVMVDDATLTPELANPDPSSPRKLWLKLINGKTVDIKKPQQNGFLTLLEHIAAVQKGRLEVTPEVTPEVETETKAEAEKVKWKKHKDFDMEGIWETEVNGYKYQAVFTTTAGGIRMWEWRRKGGKWVGDFSILNKEDLGTRIQEDVAKRGPKPKPVQNAATVKEIKDTAKKMGMGGKLDKELKVVQSLDEVPADVTDEASRKALAESVVEGIAVVDDGVVYIIADHVARNRVEQVLTHEMVTHFGLRETFGEAKVNELLDSMAEDDLIRKESERVAAERDIDVSTAEGLREATEEWLAEFSEDADLNPNLWTRIVAKVREWLRSVGMVETWSENDVRVLLSKAAKTVTRATPRSTTDMMTNPRFVNDLDQRNYAPIQESLEEADPDFPEITSNNVRYSKKTFDKADQEGYYDDMLIRMVERGYDSAKATKFIKDIRTVSHEFIGAHLDLLDYEAVGEAVYEAIKHNHDYQYLKSEDYTTICRKTLKLAATVSEIMKRAKKGLTPEQMFEVRDMLHDKNEVVNCAMCYVFSNWARVGHVLDQMAKRDIFIKAELAREASRVKREITKEAKDIVDRARKDMESAQEVIDTRLAEDKKPYKYQLNAFVKAQENYQKLLDNKDLVAKKAKGAVKKAMSAKEAGIYWDETFGDVPSDIIYDLHRRHELTAKYPEAASWLRKRGSGVGKGVETRTEYKPGLLKKYFGPEDVRTQNLFSGMRMQSWSDFDPLHLIDMMQVAAERAEIGLAAHAYTKMPDFVRLMAPTGVLVNMSLIPKGNGFNPDGSLAFDPVEGMPFEEALALREQYRTAGTIAIGISDKHIRALMADPRIDYIIPYHRSGLSKRIQTKYGEWTDYEKSKKGKLNTGQGDKILNKAKVEERIERLKKDIARKDRRDHVMSWEWFDKTADAATNSKNFVKYAKENGYAPRFEQFADDPNYYKLLVDRKMYDSEGKYIDQKATTLDFDMDTITDIFNRYLEAPLEETTDQLATPNQEVVEEFIDNGFKRNPKKDRQRLAEAQKIAEGRGFKREGFTSSVTAEAKPKKKVRLSVRPAQTDQTLYVKPYKSGSPVAVLARKLKKSDRQAVKLAAKAMAKLVEGPATLVPVPGSDGSVKANLALANAIAKLVPNVTVSDAIRKETKTESQHALHHAGKPRLTPAELNMVATSTPDGKVYLVDNVEASGATVMAARGALGKGQGLVYSKDLGYEGTPYTATEQSKGLTKEKIDAIVPGELSEEEHVEQSQYPATSPAYEYRVSESTGTTGYAETPKRGADQGRKVSGAKGKIGYRKQDSSLRNTLTKVGYLHLPHHTVTHPREAAEILHELRNPSQEKVSILAMDEDGKVLSVNIMTMGLLTSSQVAPKQFLQIVQATGGKRFIVVHNHPSGDPSPSTQDIDVTKMLERAADHAGVKLIDHIILDGDTFYSLTKGSEGQYSVRATKEKVAVNVLGDFGVRTTIAGKVNVNPKLSSPLLAAEYIRETLDGTNQTIVLGLDTRNRIVTNTVFNDTPNLERTREAVLATTSAPTVARMIIGGANMNFAKYAKFHSVAEDLGVPLVDMVDYKATSFSARQQGLLGESSEAYKVDKDIRLTTTKKQTTTTEERRRREREYGPDTIPRPPKNMDGREAREYSSPHEMYAKPREKVDWKQAAKDWGKTAMQKMGRGARNALVTIGNRLEKLSPKVFKVAAKLMADINTKTAADLAIAMDYINKMRKMGKKSPADRRVYNLARMNAGPNLENDPYVEEANNIIKRMNKEYDMETEYEAYRKMIDSYVDSFWNVGVEVYKRAMYFPRVVKDHIGLLTHLRGTDEWNYISDKIKKINAGRDQALSEMEEAEIANQMLQGIIPGLPATGVKANKARVIRVITPEMMKFYAHPDEALLSYIRQNTALIEWRKFLGKTNPEVAKLMRRVKQARAKVVEWYSRMNSSHAVLDNMAMSQGMRDIAERRYKRAKSNLTKWRDRRAELLDELGVVGSTPSEARLGMTSSIGAQVMELSKTAKLTAEQTVELKNLLEALWDDSGITSGALRFYRDATLLGALGQVSSAITQIQDLAWSFYANGVWHTTRALGKALARKSDVTKEMIIPDIMPEFGKSSTSATSYVLNWVLRATGMEYADTVGKETLMNASLAKANAQIKAIRTAKNSDGSWKSGVTQEQKAEAEQAEAKLRERLGTLFNDDFYQVMADLMTGDTNNQTVKRFAHFMLGEYQPVSRLETPAPATGNWRLAYVLKTYQIKQINNYITKIRRGLVKAHETGDKKEITRLVGEMTMMLFALAVMGAGADALKDIVYGRKVKPKDISVDVLSQLVGMSRWDVYNVRREGMTMALLKRLVPQAKIIDYTVKDIMREEGKPASLPGIVPVFGKFYYWYSGPGKARKNEE